MTRAEYMRRLEAALAKVPREEKEEALRYYNEYFDDAGPENEQQVIAELGSPQMVASQIKADYAMKNLNNQQNASVRSGMSAIWWVILGIFAAPVAFPIAIVAVALIFAAVVTLGCLFFALLATVVALFAGGIFTIFIGFSVLAADVAVAIAAIGTGLALVGGTVLAGILVVIVARAVFTGLARSIGNGMARRRGGAYRG